MKRIGGGGSGLIFLRVQTGLARKRGSEMCQRDSSVWSWGSGLGEDKFWQTLLHIAHWAILHQTFIWGEVGAEIFPESNFCGFSSLTFHCVCMCVSWLDSYGASVIMWSLSLREECSFLPGIADRCHTATPTCPNRGSVKRMGNISARCPDGDPTVLGISLTLCFHKQQTLQGLRLQSHQWDLSHIWTRMICVSVFHFQTIW